MPELDSSLSLDVEPALASLDAIQTAGLSALDAIASTPVDIAVALDTTAIDEAAAALADLSVEPFVLDVDFSAVEEAQAALAGLGETVTVALDVDTGAVEGAADAVAGLGADQTVAVTVDVDEGSIEGLSSLGGDAVVSVELDADALAFAELQIAELGAAPVVVSVELDGGSVAAVEDTLSSLSVEPVALTVDTSDVGAATAEVEQLAAASESVAPPNVSGGDLPQFSADAQGAAESTRSLGTAVDNFTAFSLGRSNAVTSALSSISPVAAAATASIGLFFYEAFQGAAEAETAMARFTDVFGSAGPIVDTVDIGGLNVSLEQLAVTLGADDDRVRIMAAGLGALGVQAGATKEEVAAVSEQFVAVASYLSATNPALGATEDVMARLGPALIRGGAAASRLGLALSSTEVAARAQEIALSRGSDTVNSYDKQAAALGITVERLGDQLGTGIERGSQRAGVQLRSFRQQVEEAVEGAGQALVGPGLQLGQQFFPILADVIGLVGDAAAEMAPLFMGALGALGFTADVLRPVIDVLEDIPGPVLQGAAAFYGLSKVLPAVTSLSGRLVSVASTGADKLHLFSTAGRLDSFATGARNAAGLASASGGAERAAFRLEASLAAQSRASTAAAIASGRTAGAERAAAAAATGASAAHVNAARALTAEELAAIQAQGGLTQLTVKERLAAVATLGYAQNVKGTQAALTSLGVTTKVTAANVGAVGAAAKMSGAASVIAGGQMAAAGVAVEGAGKKAALAGAGFSKALGAIGLIVTVGFTLAQMFGVFDDEVDDSAESVRAWSDTLKSAGDAMTNAEAAARLTAAEIGRIGDNASRSAGIKQLEDDLGEYVDTLSEAGLTTGDYFDAIDEGGSALVAFRQRLVDTGAVQLDLKEDTEETRAAQAAFGEEFVRSGDALAAAHAGARALGGDMLDLARATHEGVIEGGELAGSIDEQSEAYEKVRGSILKAAAAEVEAGNAANTANIRRAAENGWLDLLTPKQREMALVLVDGAAALDAQAKSLDDGATAADRKAKADADAEKAAQELADAYKTLDDALSRSADAFRDYLGIPLTAFEKQLQLAEDTASLADATKEVGIALDATGRAFVTSTEAGLKQGDAFAQVAQHGLEAAAAAEKTADGAAGAAAEIDRYRAIIVNAAQAGGATVEQANALADALGLIRGRTFSAEVHVPGLKESRETAEALRIGLGLLDADFVATIKMDGATQVQEVVDATVKQFDRVPDDKKVKFAVDFRDMVEALDLDDELRQRPDIKKILEVAADIGEAQREYNIIAARPDVERFLRMHPDFGAAFSKYETAEKLANLQKKLGISDEELDAAVAKYEALRRAANIRKEALVDTRVNPVSVAEANREMEGLTRRREAIVDVTLNVDERSIIVGTGVAPVYRMAHGGVLDDDEEHMAQIARAGAMRVWAEPETGGEAYIPLASTKRPRSTAILADVADRFGFDLVDERLGQPTRLSVEVAAPLVTVDVAAPDVTVNVAGPTVDVAGPSVNVDVSTTVDAAPVVAALRSLPTFERPAGRAVDATSPVPAYTQPVVQADRPDLSAVAASNESVASAIRDVARSVEGTRQRPGTVDARRTVNIGRVDARRDDDGWLADVVAALR